MEEIRIRATTAADVPAIVDIVDRAYRHYIVRIGKPPGPMLDDYLARVSEDLVWVLQDGPAIAGILVLPTAPEYLLLDNIAIAPERQGRLGPPAPRLCGKRSLAARLSRDPALHAPDDDRESAPLRFDRLRGDGTRERGRLRSRLHAEAAS
jgi:hypothetical protein